MTVSNCVAVIAALAISARAVSAAPVAAANSTTPDVDPAVLAYLQQANLSSADPHLYFYWINTNGEPDSCKKTGGCRCGDIDAASRMPAELFEPQNILSLALYATITIQSYSSLGMGGQKLKLGTCAKYTEYTCAAGGVQGINWISGALMVPICQKQCDCTYPSCRDQPDDPAAGKFCSLCGPKYNGYITISLSNLPNTAFDDDDNNGAFGPCGESLLKSIPEILAANPDLSTLLRLVSAADIAGSLPRPVTLFAPTNAAFQALPPFTVARLLQPKNKAELVDLLSYHLVPNSYCTITTPDNRAWCDKDLDTGLQLRTVEGQTATISSNYVGPPPYTRAVRVNGANVVTADIRAGGGVVHTLDAVLMPPNGGQW